MDTRRLLVALAVVLAFDTVITFIYWNLEVNPILLDMGRVPSFLFKSSLIPVVCGWFYRYRSYAFARAGAISITVGYGLLGAVNVLGIVGWL